MSVTGVGAGAVGTTALVRRLSDARTVIRAGDTADAPGIEQQSERAERDGFHPL
jgi:hypothetical protein